MILSNSLMDKILAVLLNCKASIKENDENSYLIGGITDCIDGIYEESKISRWTEKDIVTRARELKYKITPEIGRKILEEIEKHHGAIININRDTVDRFITKTIMDR
jgi:hypothetical protein